MSSVLLATTAINCCFNKRKNLDKFLKFIREAAESGCDLIVFPEQSLQGYLSNIPGPVTPEMLLYQKENAEIVPEGPSTQELIKAAREYDSILSGE